MFYRYNSFSCLSEGFNYLFFFPLLSLFSGVTYHFFQSLHYGGDFSQMSDNINCWLLFNNEALKRLLELCNGLGFRNGEVCYRLSDRKFFYTVGGPKYQINRIYSISPWKNPLPGKSCPAFYAQFVRRYFIHKLSINPSVFSPTSYSCPLGIHAISAGAVCFPLDSIILHVPGCSFPCPTLSVTLPHEIFSLETFWNLSFTLVCDHSLFFFLVSWQLHLLTWQYIWSFKLFPCF